MEAGIRAGKSDESSAVNKGLENNKNRRGKNGTLLNS